MREINRQIPEGRVTRIRGQSARALRQEWVYYGQRTAGRPVARLEWARGREMGAQVTEVTEARS